MKELNSKQEKFYSRWKDRRNKKFTYIFLHGTVYWGLPLGVLMFLLQCHFRTENMNLSGFITSIILFGIGGLFWGLNQYNGIDKTYLELNDDKEIADGIKKLETGGAWDYENLAIIKENKETLIVKNKLFWLDDTNALSGDLEECLDLVMKDFEQLKKNPDFYIFSRKHKVKVQVYNNSEKSAPLLEVTI